MTSTFLSYSSKSTQLQESHSLIRQKLTNLPLERGICLYLEEKPFAALFAEIVAKILR
jgi:hypothetical protein